MSDSWLQKYILLAFRIDKVVQAAYGSQFIWWQEAIDKPALPPNEP
jgi:hypothetical protein